MKPITKKKGWSLLLVLGILMPYLTGILPYIEVNAEPSTVTVSNTILDTSDAKVDVTYEVAEKEITWQVDYTKHATPENVQRQLKLRIDDAASGHGTVRNLNRDAADSEGWYVLHDTYSSKEEKGSLTFKTDIQDFVEGTHYLKFTVQLDEKVSEEIQVEAVTELQMIDEEEVEVEIAPATTEEKETVNSTILNDQDAGPHKVTVEPSLIAEVAPQEEVEEEATEESSAEEIVEEAEVDGEVENGDVETEVEAEAGGEIEVEAEEGSGEITLMGPIQGLSSRAAVVNYQNLEPQYTTNETGNNLGTFPTSNWGTGNVLNHTGAQTNSSWDPNSTDNFINYFAQGSGRDEADFGIKKYAQEATEVLSGNVDESIQGLFDILLEVRGNTIDSTTAQPIDLLLVADRSGSMQGTRWSNLQTGVAQFMSTITDLGLEETIHLGYVSFAKQASTVDGYPVSAGGQTLTHYSVPIGEVTADQKEKINNELTEKRNQFNNGSLTDSEVNRPAGGTNTHAGLLEAQNILQQRVSSQRPNTKTVVVLLTDGVPTFHYAITGAVADTSLPDDVKATSANTGSIKGSGRQADLRTGGTEPSHREYTVNGQTITNNFIAASSAAKDIRGSGVEIRVIGIQLTAETNNDTGFEQYSLAKIEERMRDIASPKSDGSGEYYYTNVNAASGIVSELSSIAHEFTSTVSNAEISDPMGEDILFQGDSSNITVTQIAGDDLDASQIPNATYNAATGSVSVTNIHAGAGQTVQIRYQVRIDTESEDFVSEKWYPANGPTTFNLEGNTVDFGVPSIKAPGKELDVSKFWVDDLAENRPDEVVFDVTRESSSENTNDLKGTISLSAADWADDNEWNMQFTKMTITNDDASEYLVSLAKFDNHGKDFSYLVEEIVPNDYDLTNSGINESGTIWFENTLKYQPMGLNILKVSDQGATSLTGAEFSLSGTGIGDGENDSVTLLDKGDGSYELVATTEFKGLAKNGEYILTETKAPTGHSLSDPSSWEIVMTDGVATIDGKVVDPTNNVIQYTVTNPFNKLSLEVEKLNGAIPLDGATFVLEKDGVQIGVPQVSANGLVNFGELTPGNYLLQETVAPDGYALSNPAEWAFTIDAYGQLTGEGFALDGLTIYKEVQNYLKNFDLTVNKLGEQGEALSGAEFTLTMLENDDFAPIVRGTDGNLSTFLFENLAPGTYQLEETKNPSTHIMLENPITIVIDDEGNVMVDEDEELADVVLTSGESNNTISFNVTNKAKTPLPSTGGMGTPIFFILGGVLMLVVGLAVFQVKRNEKGAF